MDTETPKPKRKSLTKRTRFEIFKRDGFKCQYCGQSAPDVALRVDHVIPVAGGGSNDALNLITSCFGCNAGKSDVPLSADVVVEKARKQAQELQERREQIQMMAEWHLSLVDCKNDEVNAIEALILKLTNYKINDCGRSAARKWLKKFSLHEILTATSQAAEIYAKKDEAGSVSQDDYELMFSKIPGVASMHRLDKEDPSAREVFYIRGILRNRFDCKTRININAIPLIKRCLAAGAELKGIKTLALEAGSFSAFEDNCYTFLKYSECPKDS